MRNQANLERTLRPLFDLIPLHASMPFLVGSRNPSPSELSVVEDLCSRLGDAHLAAGLWLYVSDLDRSHAISQRLDTPLGAYWHGVMHRREGDFANSKYWLNRAKEVTLSIPGYRPDQFVDAVESDPTREDPRLIHVQREEWSALFDLCLAMRAENEEHAIRKGRVS